MTFYKPAILLSAFVLLMTSAQAENMPEPGYVFKTQAQPLSGYVSRHSSFFNNSDLPPTAPSFIRQLPIQGQAAAANLAGQVEQLGNLRLVRQEPKIDYSKPVTPQIGRALTEVESNSAPFIWNQSRMGGYYDSTGNIKEVVPGARLNEYGGKFADGTPVFGNAKTNFAGHVYWKPGLNPNYFWDH